MGRHTRRVMSSAGSFFPELTAGRTWPNEEQLKRLRLAYPELAGELESRGEWQGAMEYWIADDFESGTSWPVYLLDLEPEGPA